MTSSKHLCFTCQKAISMFTCHGCKNEYCFIHANEHRQNLDNQMNEIINQHDQYIQIISDKKEQLNFHPLFNEINQWENESIKKIHNLAEKTRQNLFNIINNNLQKSIENIQNLTKELTIARNNNDYIENDLNNFITKLEIIKKDLYQQDHTIIEYNNNNPLIFNITINSNLKEIFDTYLGNIKIIENNQVIYHDLINGYASIRCQNEYSFNRHSYLFKIEQLNEGKWFFIGIISKNINLELNPLKTQTSYGWSTYDNICLNGLIYVNYNGYKTDIEMNDILELIIDCNKHIIYLINQRTKSLNELYIDLNKCPFPWQIHLGLYFKNDQIRILST